MNPTATTTSGRAMASLGARIWAFVAALMLSVGLFGASAANAAGSVAFTSPADGSSAPVGTSITPEGVASATGTVGGGLDLVLVLDSSGSMATTNLGKTRQQWQREAAIAIVNALPASTSRVAVVEFDSNANLVRTLTTLTPAANKQLVIDAINGVDASGGTFIGSGIAVGNTELNNNALPGVSKQMVVFSDGSTSGNPAVEAAAAFADGINVHAVALPGAVVSTMQGIANAGNGIFANFTNPADLVNITNAFSGTGGTPIGIDKIVVTLPDGTVIDPNSIGGLGNFTVDQAFNINAGANTWHVTAFFSDGSTATDTVTVNGVQGGVIPLPAGLPLMLGGLGLLGLLGARRRKG